MNPLLDDWEPSLFLSLFLIYVRRVSLFRWPWHCSGAVGGVDGD